jgi:cyclopropane fatty-acyl-phospholipid synthase-like methyltransferase
MVDVGCGIGGSSRHIARKFGCEARGITLSPVQAQRANQITAQQGLGDSVLGPALATAQVASIAGLLMGSKLPRNGSVVLGGLPLL